MQMPKTDIDADTHACRHHLNAFTLRDNKSGSQVQRDTSKGFARRVSVGATPPSSGTFLLTVSQVNA
jgi:hypothetical protein